MRGSDLATPVFATESRRNRHAGFALVSRPDTVSALKPPIEEMIAEAVAKASGMSMYVNA